MRGTNRPHPFGKLLTRIREDAGLSQEEMANRIKAWGYVGREGDFQQTTYSNIERTPDYHDLRPRSFVNAVQNATGIPNEVKEELFRLYIEQLG